MHTSTLMTVFMQLFLPAMHQAHPLAPICRAMQDVSDPEQRYQALRTLATGADSTPLQQAAALLLLSEEQRAQDVLKSLLQDAAHQLQSTLRLAHVLLACLWCEQSKPQEALSRWHAGLQHRAFSHDEAIMQRVGFHPGTAILCRCIAQTLLNPSVDAYHRCREALVWRPGDPSLLVLRAINAITLSDEAEGRHALRLAETQMRALSTPLPPHGAEITTHLLVPTLIAWMSKRQGSTLLQRYDDAIEWLEDTQQDSEEKVALQSPLQKERALLRVLLAQQTHARLRTLQECLRQA
ncbi:hypothetical protein [Ktedonospora formicarum]|uniref:Uncharacterized protein n=1 Tax=Ktedonospora formicarum TaxID=2778364 RepID=A0A8J3I7E9_9CHLR|nr:hypothetical protein [Ktedonospora formicarum]GHO48488.1 hypothetical protein KSX_66510 [Ktedonospora formicarum]